MFPDVIVLWLLGGVVCKSVLSVVTVIQFSILPKGAEGCAPFCSPVVLGPSLYTWEASTFLLGSTTPMLHLLPPTLWCLPRLTPEVPKEEEESTLFPLQFPVFVFTPSRAKWFGPFLFQVPLTVGSSFHLPPSHTCTCGTHTHSHPPAI